MEPFKRFYGGGFVTGTYGVDHLAPVGGVVPSAADCAAACLDSEACQGYVWVYSGECYRHVNYYTGYDVETSGEYTSGECQFRQGASRAAGLAA